MSRLFLGQLQWLPHTKETGMHLRSLSEKKKRHLFEFQGRTENGPPCMVWPGPPTEGRPVSALLAAAPNLPLCWLTAAGWWSGLFLLLGWQTYRPRMGGGPGQKLWLVFYHWELGLPDEQDPAGPNLLPDV